MTDLLALASEVEALTGPSREMDARVWVALHPDDWLVLFGTVGNQDYVVNSIENRTLALPALTASIDVAYLFLTEKLPTCSFVIGGVLGFNKPLEATVVRADHLGKCTYYKAKAPTLPLAIVAAVLRAVAARGEG